MTGDRFNVYLPATLAQRVRAERKAGREFDLSAAAARGIAAELNGQEADSEHQGGAGQLGSRLDSIEHQLGQLSGQVTTAGRDLKRVILEAAAVAVGVAVLLAVALGLYLRPLSTA
jgi:hypothetical protein